MARPRILLVDDDRRVRQLVGLTLPADDYELSFTEDGTDAIRIARQTHPDLILLDYAMPGIHGAEVCAALRSDQSMAETPIIMLTGHGDEETRQRSIVAGANGFLTKPFSPIALEQTIRALLGASSLPPLSPSEIHRMPDRAPSTASPRPVAQSSSAVQTLPSAPSTLPSGPGSEHDSSPLDVERSLDGLRRRYSGLHETFAATIEALSTALEPRAAEVEGHAQRVSLYAVATARRLGVAGDELERLRWGAILHDVGMIGIPDSILMKPGRLQAEE